MEKTATVYRCDGDNNEVKSFRSWGAKVLCGIGRLPETTESRSIRIEIRKKTTDEKVEKFSLYKLDKFEVIKQKCFRFAMDNIDTLTDPSPAIPENIGDRDADNWHPLLAIAEIAGEEWPQKAIQACLRLSGIEVEDEDPKVQLLEDIQSIFKMRIEEELPTGTLLTELNTFPERPWKEWKNGNPITDRGLAQLLRGFKIQSAQFRYNGKKVRGYKKNDFLDAWKRYLSGTEGTNLKNKALQDDLSGTKREGVPHDKDEKSFKNKGVPLVPVGASLLGKN